MSRVYMGTESWGVVQDRAGNVAVSTPVTIKNADGSNATHWSSATGGTASTASITTTADGLLTRYIEAGSYLEYVNGVLIGPIEAASGGAASSLAAIATPDVLSGLYAWYDASRITGKVDGNAISQWDDLSSNGRHLVQATGANQPLYKTSIQNGKAVVRFDGSNDSVALTGLSLAQPYTILAVCRAGNGAVSDEIIMDGGSSVLLQASAASGGRYLVMGGTPFSSIIQTPKDNAFRIITGVYNGATSKIRNNGVQTTGTIGTVTLTQIRLGLLNAGTNPLNGDIAEFIIYNRALSAGEIDQVEAYLAAA